MTYEYGSGRQFVVDDVDLTGDSFALTRAILEKTVRDYWERPWTFEKWSVRFGLALLDVKEREKS